MTTTMPQTIDGLTPDWLTGALRSGGHIGDATITGVQAETVGAGVGILCLLARLTLQYDRPATGAPATVIAKIPSPDPQTRGLANVFHFYEREVRFYRDLAADISLPTPRCFYSELDEASGDFVLLLEDLAGARIGDQLAGCSADDAKLAIANLAKSHAQWWNHPRLDSLTWMPVTADPINKAGMALYPVAWPQFLERFGSNCPAEVLRIGEMLEPHFTAMLDMFSSGSRTVLHGDYRLDNLFFATSPGEVPLHVIDWQIAMRGIGTYDVGYFLSQSLDVDVRRAHEREILELYHTTLCENGVSDYSFEECLHHYRWTILGCFVYPVMGGGLGDLSNARGLALATAMTERSAAAIMDWNAGELLGELV